MKKPIFLFLVILIFITGSAFILSNTWNVDPENSSIRFELPMQYKSGSFKNLKAKIEFDTNNLAASKITASIDVNTINTGEEKKNVHLKSADFFDAEKFPLISFSSTEILKNGNKFLAIGKLSIKDSVKTIEIPFTYTEKSGSGALFNGTMSINASDYGVRRSNKPGADQVLVYLYVQVKK